MSIGEIRPGMAIIFNNELYAVMTYEHVKLGRGPAFCRAKLKNLKTAQIVENTLRDSDDVEKAFIEKRKLQYVYRDADLYHFITMDTYEDLILHQDHIADKIEWLKDNLELTGLFYNNELIDLELPLSLVLKVTHTDPGFKGDTVKASTKQAVLETGVSVAVPLFINPGDIIRVDTRTKEYLGRA